MKLDLNRDVKTKRQFVNFAKTDPKFVFPKVHIRIKI